MRHKIAFYEAIKNYYIKKRRFKLRVKYLLLGLGLLLGINLYADVTFISKETPDIKYRWIGSDRWGAEHGSNVNISPEYQRGDTDYYNIWGSFHTFFRLLPPDKYFEEHPEYYSLIGENREPRQICTSNPQVQQTVAENLKEIIRKNPEIDIVTLGPEDNRNFCQCPQCTAMDEEDPEPDQLYSRRMFLFYKKISEIVHEEFPDIILRFGCYDIYAAPPRDRSITIPENTYPLVCHFQKYCLNHPISDPLCMPNRRFREVIKGWHELTDKIFIYEYYYKVNWLDLPWPIVHSIRHDISWYRQNGVIGLYSQYNPGSAASLLNFHVASALLLDVNADVDEMINDFCVENFGPSWREMRDFFNILEMAMIDSRRCFPGSGFPNAVYVFTDEVLNRCIEQLSAAKEKAPEGLFRGNVTKFETLVDYTQRCVAFLRSTKKAEEAKGREAESIGKLALKQGRKLKDYIKENSDSFKGVIPSPERVNPYLNAIIRYLDERYEPPLDLR